MVGTDDNVSYWNLGDIRLRAAEKGDADMFLRHFRSSPARVERAFDAIGPPAVRQTAESWLSGYGVGVDGGNDGGGNGCDSGVGGGCDSGVGDGCNRLPDESGDRRVFIIEDSQNGEFLGYIDVWEADARNGVFKTGIKMLEGKAGKGHATRAFIRVMEYYFNELRYQKCDVYIYEFNDASHRFHKKLGFVEEGRLRREYYTDGRFYDSICYGLTAEEFRERALTYGK